MTSVDRDAVLARLGLDDVPSTDPDGLTALDLAWCRSVPFDNVRKRIALEADRNGPLPGLDPRDFFAVLLAHGTGATCWPGANALNWLLVACGFGAQRVAATMEPIPFPPDDPVRPNHGSNVVTLEDQRFLLDTSFLSETPIQLVTGEGAAMVDPVVGVLVEPDGARWTAEFMPWRPGGMLTCRIESLAADDELFTRRYEHSRTSGRFNEQVHVRRNFADCVQILGLGQHFVIDRPSGTTSTESTLGDQSERDRLLVEVFGFSEEIAAALPDDRAEADGQ